MLIPTAQNVKTITDMREDAVGLLKHVHKKGPAYIFYRSKPQGVVLSIKDFEELTKLTHNHIDLALALEAEQALEQDNLDDTIPLSKLLEQAKIDK